MEIATVGLDLAKSRFQLHSPVGKHRIGRISKMGDRYLRKLLVVGPTSVVRRASGAKSNPWVGKLLEHKAARVVTVAIANETARIAWAVLARGVPPCCRLISIAANAAGVELQECQSE